MTLCACLAFAPGGESVMSRANRAFEAGDYARANELYGVVLEHNPRDAVALYNRACALAQLGEVDAGAESLLGAVRHGFTRFFDMRRDETLAPLRGTVVYEEIVAHVPEILDRRGEAEFGVLVDKTSEAYRTDRDDVLRLNFASAADAESLAFMREEIERVAAWTEGNLFELPADTELDPWVAVILPTPEDFVRLVRGASTLGGYYDRDNRRLVTQDTGPSLRHEFFHVVHWRHQERLGQTHAYWVAEGLASLLEDVEVREDGAYVIEPSWRTNIAKRLARSTRFPSIAVVASMDRDRFVRARASANYAIGRSVFLYLHEKGELGAWYRAYVEGFDEDPTGVAALERVLGKGVAEFDRDLRVWLGSLPEVGEQRRPGEAWLGVDVRAGRGSGPEVRVRLRDWNRGNATPFRSRDVIKGVAGVDVRSIDDLYRVLGERSVGETVDVRVLRGGAVVTLSVKLVRRDS